MSELYPKLFALVTVVLAVLSFIKLLSLATVLTNNVVFRWSFALMLAAAVCVVAFICYLSLVTSIWGA